VYYLTTESKLANDSKHDVRDAQTYAVLSSVIGAIAGLSTILTGFRYYYAGWPAHGPVGVLGIFFVIFGLLTILGSALVLLSRRTRLAGLLWYWFLGL
jgi:uncharacterized membrane protein